jgi:PAS domain S-box-containing protein
MAGWDLTRERATTSELERLVDLSVDMLCVMSLSSRFLVVNPAWTLTLGWPEAELRGRRAFELIHPDDRERALLQGARLREPGAEVHDFEVRCRHRDGSERWLVWGVRSDGERLYAVARDVTSRRLAEETLRNNEQWLRKLVETAHEGIWVLDAEDRTTFVNERLAQMLGYGVDEMLGRPVYDFLTEPGTELARSRLAGRRRGISDSQESRLVRKDGEEIWVIVSGSPLTREDGSYAGTLDMLVDIADRRGREQALRASEERYRNIVETTAEGVWMIDADHHTTYVNRRMAEMLGYTIDEMLGRPVSDFLGATGQPDAALEPRQREVLYVRKDGSRMWGLLSGSPLTNGNGGYGGALAMVSDITERKHAEVERARLAAIVESSPDAIFSTDTDHVITSWNRAAERLYGYTEQEAVGQPVFMLAPPDKLDAWQQMGRLLDDGGAQQSFVGEQVHKDGSLLPVESSLSAIHSADGRVMGALAIVRAR